MNRTFVIPTLIVVSLLSGCCLFSDLPCATPQGEYAIDKLPGCEDCTSVLDKEMLADLVNQIETGEFGNLHSLVIIHNDSVALEKYFMGWTRHMRHNCFSVTKSIMSTLIGIAVEQGYINGTDEKLLGFFSEYDDIANLDARKESIILEDVLTMSAGFIWDETHEAEMSESSDWIKYMLDLPMSDDPGTQFVYNNGGSHLLSAIITHQTGQSTEEFAQDNLFDQLGITNWEWQSDPNGINTGGWGLYLHPANMAIFGYLYLKNGFFNGKHVIPEHWVNVSTAKHIEVIDIESGSHDSDYGYQWWKILPIDSRNSFFALGHGGQFITILPDHNMVVVITAGNSAEDYVSLAFQILFGHIVPAVQEN